MRGLSPVKVPRRSKKPKLVIRDEPTQGVDIGAKVEIHKLIRLLAKDGPAVLMILSDLPEVLGMSDRIAVMRGGTITAMPDGASANGARRQAAARCHSPCEVLRVRLDGDLNLIILRRMSACGPPKGNLADAEWRILWPVLIQNGNVT